MRLEDHPTVQRIRLHVAASPRKESPDSKWLKQLVLDAGADDVGFVEIGRAALYDQREDILKAFPHTKTLISFVVRMNREAIRTPARSVSNNVRDKPLERGPQNGVHQENRPSPKTQVPKRTGLAFSRKSLSLRK